jgi:hypothetical protein
MAAFFKESAAIHCDPLTSAIKVPVRLSGFSMLVSFRQEKSASITRTDIIMSEKRVLWKNR